MRFIDANVFVYHLAKDAAFGDRARDILLRIEEGEEAVIPTLVIAQVCGYLRWKKASDIVLDFIDLLRSMLSLEKSETLFEDFTSACSLLPETSLSWKSWDDLVIASQMQRLGISEIYSNDEDFDHIPGIKRIF